MKAVELYVQSVTVKVSLSARWGILPIPRLGIGIKNISLRAASMQPIHQSLAIRRLKKLQQLNTMHPIV